MDLITEYHKAQYRQYYEGKEVGQHPSRWQSLIERLAALSGSQTILDYGCGGYPRLEAHVKEYAVLSYDPALPGYDNPPEPADLVVCIDVLEHVEPDKIDAVIYHLHSLAQKALFISVSTQESESKTLPDGTPWHVFVRSRNWWKGRFKDMKFLKADKKRQEVTFYKIIGEDNAEI